MPKGLSHGNTSIQWDTTEDIGSSPKKRGKLLHVGRAGNGDGPLVNCAFRGQNTLF